MRLLAADVVLNLLSLPIIPSCGHQSLLSRLSYPNSLCIVVRKIHTHQGLQTEPDECEGRAAFHPSSRVSSAPASGLNHFPSPLQDSVLSKHMSVWGRAVEILSAFDSWARRQRAWSGRCWSPGSLTSRHWRAPAAGLFHPLSSLFVCQVSDSQRQITDLILLTVCAWYAMDAAGDPCQVPHLARSLEETEKATCMPICSWIKYKNRMGKCFSRAEQSDWMAILRCLSFMMHVNAGMKTSFTLIKSTHYL